MKEFMRKYIASLGALFEFSSTYAPLYAAVFTYMAILIAVGLGMIWLLDLFL